MVEYKFYNLRDILKHVEVGDKVVVGNSEVGVIVTYGSGYNVLFEDGEYGDLLPISSLDELVNEYWDTWDGNFVLIKKNYIDFKDVIQNSVNTKFVIKSEYCNGIVTLLNFNPGGSSTFLDNKDKLSIIPTSSIECMIRLYD